MRNVPIMCNTNYALRAFLIQDINDILGQQLEPEVTGILWLIRAAVAQHIRDDESIAWRAWGSRSKRLFVVVCMHTFLVEVTNLVMPVVRAGWETVYEK